jgi:hypothetical protein
MAIRALNTSPSSLRALRGLRGELCLDRVKERFNHEGHEEHEGGKERKREGVQRDPFRMREQGWRLARLQPIPSFAASSLAFFPSCSSWSSW